LNKEVVQGVLRFLCPPNRPRFQNKIKDQTVSLLIEQSTADLRKGFENVVLGFQGNDLLI